MRDLLRNWSYLLLSDVSQSVISFLVFMFLARKLAPDGYGNLNAVLALTSLFAVFAGNLSTNQVITREVTLHPESTRKIFRLLLGIRLLTLLVALPVLLMCQFSTGDHDVTIMVCSAFLVVSLTVWDAAESVAFGHFVTRVTSILNISTSAIWLLMIVVLPAGATNYQIILVLFTILSIAKGGVYCRYSYRKFATGNNVSAPLPVQSLLLMSLPYLWMRILAAGAENVPILLLKSYGGASEVAYFAVGLRFVLPITLVVGTGLRAAFPFMTKLFNDNREQFNQRLKVAFCFVLLLGSTLAALLTLTSPWWLPLLLGNSYGEAVAAFNYQSWFGVLLSFDLLLSAVLSSTYRQKMLAVLTTVDVVVVFPLLYVGSQYGANGLAISRLIGVLITTSYHIVIVAKVLGVNLRDRAFIASTLYFLFVMGLTIVVPGTSVKVLLLVTVILSLSMSRHSPLRELGVKGAETLKRVLLER